MRDKVKYRNVPGFHEDLVVSDSGRVYLKGKELYQSDRGGYKHVYLPPRYRSPTKSLKVHRLVAMAFVPNPDPENKTIVNHKDGNPCNNTADNLEWCTYSENNIHAIKNGLRSDNIGVKARDFNTGTIFIFDSISSAVELLELSTNYPPSVFPKMFGKLVKDRWELKPLGDTSPWFYENRKDRITPSRFMFVVDDGSEVTEVFGVTDFKSKYKLWNCKDNSAKGLVREFLKKYPDSTVELFDSYEKEYPSNQNRKSSRPMAIIAKRDLEGITFPSLTKAAQYFKVDRDVIKHRLANKKDLAGWYFEKLDNIAR